MAAESADRKINTGVNTDAKTGNDGVKRLPHERDESPDGHGKEARGVMKQAAADLAQGLVDTDMHGMRGVEEAVPDVKSGQARPQDDAASGMRHSDTSAPPRGK